MSKNIDQIYNANPITTNASTDLMYFGQSPYSSNDDAAMLFSDFQAQFSGGGVTSDQVQQSIFNYGVDSGTADNYVVDLSPAISSLTDGLIVGFKPAHTNLTQSPMITVNGFGPTLITGQSGANQIDIGALADTQFAYCVYSQGNTVFTLLNPYTQIQSTQIQESAFNYGTDSGTTNHYAVNLSPVVASLTDGLIVIFQPANTNTGPASFISINGISEVLITTIYNQDVTAGDITTNNVAIMIYSNATGGFQLLNPTITPFAVKSQVASGFFNLGIDSGAADAYVISTNLPLGAYHDGQVVAFTPTHNNATTTPTMDVDGNGPKTMTTASAAVALSSGQVSTTQLCYCVYSLAADKFLVLTPA